MTARNVILRIMLWSLALAAVTGVLTVFVQRGSFMWRVIGTEICAAVACALILPCIPLMDREKTRAAGLLGMIGVVVEFLLALTVIWDLPQTLTGVTLDEEPVVTMVLLALAAIVSAALLRLRHMTTHVFAANLALAVVAVALCVFLIAVWRRPMYDDFSERCWETGAAVLAMGATASICLLGLGGPSRRRWRWLGIACAAGAFALWLGDIWIGSGSDIGFATFTGLLAGSVVIAYAIACLLCPLKPTQSWLRGAAVAAAVLTAVLIELWTLIDRGLLLVETDTFWIDRCMAASGIVTGCGTLALVVLARLNRRVDFEPDSGAITDIVVVCPRCRKKQCIPIGDAVCGACQLRISTRIEEPRCPTCEYLLLGLTSNRCPECGTTISTAIST